MMSLNQEAMNMLVTRHDDRVDSDPEDRSFITSVRLVKSERIDGFCAKNGGDLVWGTVEVDFQLDDLKFTYSEDFMLEDGIDVAFEQNYDNRDVYVRNVDIETACDLWIAIVNASRSQDPESPDRLSSVLSDTAYYYFVDQMIEQYEAG